MKDYLFISFSIEPLSWLNTVACLLCGGMIGLERQLQGKPVGIRTSAMITLGSYIFLALGTSLTTPEMDRSRVLGQLVTGIGFLGAGVMMTRNGRVFGVTSAATVWVLAGLGAMIGLDMLRQAVLMTLVILCILTTFNVLQKGVHRKRRVVKFSQKSSVQDNVHQD